MADEPGQFGRIEIPVEFSSKGMKASSKAVSKVAQEEGRAIAKEMMAGLERQFQVDMARIKDGQMRGFLSPAEARKAGRDAAVEFNRGVIQVIDQASATGAFRGKAGKQLFADIAGELKNIEAAGRRGGLGLGRLNDALFTVARQATGSSVVLSKLVDTIGTFAIGVGPMVPIVAGIAAIAYGISRITAESRAAKEALDEALERLEKLKEGQDLGDTGKTPGDVLLAMMNRRRLEGEQTAIEAALRAPRVAAAEDQLSEEQARASLEKRLEEVKKEYEREGELIRAGTAEVRRIRREAAEKDEREAEQAKNKADAAARKRESEEAEAQRRREAVARTENALQSRLADLTASAQDDLMLVIDQLEAEGKKAAAEAGVEVSAAFIAGIAQLRADAGLQEVLRQVQDVFKGLRNEDRSDTSQTRLQHYIDQLKAYAATLADGSAIQAKYNDLIRQAEELHSDNAAALEREAKAQGKRDATEKERDRRQELSDLREKARAIEENARAAIQLANAIGTISDETMDALENLAQLGASVFRIVSGDLTAIPSAIGAAAQLAKNVFGDAEKERAERLKQVDAMVSLERAIRELRTAVLHDVSDRERRQIVDDLGSFAPLQAGNLAWLNMSGKKTQKLDHIPVAVLAALKQLHEITGIDFFDESTGVLDVQKFQAAMEQLSQLKLGVFPDTIRGKIDARHFERSITGEGNAEDNFSSFIADLRGAQGGDAKRVADALAKALQSGGPQAVRDMFNEWARLLASGDQSLFQAGGIFEDLTGDELRDILEEGNTLLEDLLERSGGTTQDFVQARSITEVTASRMLGLDLTRNVLLEQIRDLIAGQMGVDAASLSSASGFGAAARAGLPTSAGIAGSITLQIAGPLVGEVTLTGQAGIVGSAQAQAEVESMMVRALEGALDSIDQRLADRYQARLRAGGRA